MKKSTLALYAVGGLALAGAGVLLWQQFMTQNALAQMEPSAGAGDAPSGDGEIPTVDGTWIDPLPNEGDVVSIPLNGGGSGYDGGNKSPYPELMP